MNLFKLVRYFLLIVTTGWLYFFLGTEVSAKTATIVVSLEGGKKINKRVFGMNLIGYDPTTYEDRKTAYLGYSDYGAGIWDPKWDLNVKDVMTLLKNINSPVFRFPGGCGVHHYDWKETIKKDRKKFQYGMAEFLKTVDSLEAETVITVSDFTGEENDAADLVSFLNLPADRRSPWVEERKKQGHEKPFSVKFFEIGNETYHGDHRNIEAVTPEAYAKRYLKFYTAMKAIDPSILIGAVLWNDAWNQGVMEIIRDKVDFGIMHIYPSPNVNNNVLSRMNPNVIYAITLARPLIIDEFNIKKNLLLLQKYGGRSIPIAVTEYNGGFVQGSPVPYRHCLGTALLNAELLNLFMKQENNILMANYWNFCNEYWGMIANNFDGTNNTLYRPYYKRPNYFVFEMYKQHYGDIGVTVDVESEGYDASVYQPIRSLIKRMKVGKELSGNLIHGHWLIDELPGVYSREINDILEIDFTSPVQLNYYHSRKQSEVAPATYYKLSGYIKTEQLIGPRGVCLEVQDVRGWNQTKSAEPTEVVKGTTDWEYVEVVYETLPDAKAVNVIARRIGEDGPLKGKAFFRDVKFEKYIPSVDTKIPYLSVNASKNYDGNKVFLMVVNKNMGESMPATIELKDFVPVAKGNAWVLNGPAIDSTNEKQPHNAVKVSHQEFEIKGNPFEFTFEPHSLTAIEVERKQ